MVLEIETDVLEKRNIDLKEEENAKIDVEVDVERELICSLNEIERSRKKKWIQKDQLKK
jgi:hypothetical protein